MTYDSNFSFSENAPAYMMAANEGVIKAIVCNKSFYRDDSDMAFERQRGRILINDVNRVLELMKHLVSFLSQSIAIEASPNKTQSS